MDSESKEIILQYIGKYFKNKFDGTKRIYVTSFNMKTWTFYAMLLITKPDEYTIKYVDYITLNDFKNFYKSIEEEEYVRAYKMAMDYYELHRHSVAKDQELNLIKTENYE